MTHRIRRFVLVPCFAAAMVVSACSGSTGGGETTAATGVTALTSQLPDAEEEIPVVFDTPGADPRPLRETDVEIGAPVSALRMRVTDLTYRGVVCGFTFLGTRPVSPVTIRIEGTVPTGSFSSGPVEIRWTDDGAASADAPGSDNGWSFSADAYPSRNNPGWAVSIGAVTGEGENVNPSDVTCELRSGSQFVPANGPVGYWAGFASV